MITDLIGGQVPMGMPGVTGQVIEFHRSGRLRVLAVTSSTRLVAAPELPTVAEMGFPGMTVKGSIGLLAPAGTPTGIIEKIAQASRRTLAEPAFQQILLEAGIEPAREFKPTNLSVVPRGGSRPLGAGRQTARVKDRLSSSRATATAHTAAGLLRRNWDPPIPAVATPQPDLVAVLMNDYAEARRASIREIPSRRPSDTSVASVGRPREQ